MLLSSGGCLCDVVRVLDLAVGKLISRPQHTAGRAFGAHVRSFCSTVFGFLPSGRLGSGPIAAHSCIKCIYACPGPFGETTSNPGAGGSLPQECRRVIVVRLEGGLGNQLFQFSYGLALQARYGGRLVFDDRLVRDDPSKANVLAQVAELDERGYADTLVSFVGRLYAGAAIRIFGLWRCDGELAARRLAAFGIHHPFTKRYCELATTYLPFIYLHGYFMSEKYFASAAGLVRSSLRLSGALGPNLLNLVPKLEASNSVAVHVRRGDYLSDQWRDKLHICSEDYYERAVNLVMERVDSPVFYVFSNSIEDTHWVQRKFQFWPAGTVFVPPAKSDVEHFALMTSCRHFILANSTFSWWASYLSVYQDKVIVAPLPWTRDDFDMSDIYCSRWSIVGLDLLAKRTDSYR